MFQVLISYIAISASAAAANSLPASHDLACPAGCAMDGVGSHSLARCCGPLTITGWSEMSFTASTASDNNLPLGFNFVANDFLLQQNWIRIKQPVDEQAHAVDLGFQTDWILPGSDYQFTQARGLFNGQPNRAGIDPVQFYLEAFIPEVAGGMNVKLGRFYAPVTPESIAGPDNWLVSHSQTFMYDPFTQTGIVIATDVNCAWSVTAGLVMGNDVFIDPAASPTFVGGISWSGCEERTSVSTTVILGSGEFDQQENLNRENIFDCVVRHQVAADLQLIFEGLFGYQQNVPSFGTVSWFSVVSYLKYDLNECISSACRLEFFNDEQGHLTGFKGLYTALTAGLTIQMTPRLVFRPELRVDSNDTSRPFDGAAQLLTATADVILTW